MHDLVLSNKQSFVFDGTFSKYEKAEDNIRRSLVKGRGVFIFYIYQNPEVAWRFTEAREAAEGRNIPKSAFIDQFLGSRFTINKILDEFKKEVTTFLVMKDFENKLEDIYLINEGKLQIDRHIKEDYTKDKLEKLL